MLPIGRTTHILSVMRIFFVQYRTNKIQSLFSYIVDLTKDIEGQKKDSPIKNTDESSLVAGTGLSFISFRMDINGGLQRKAQTTS